jgi:hypothetical protein
MKTLFTALALAALVATPVLAQQRTLSNQVCPSGTVLSTDGNGQVVCRDYQNTRD